MKINLLKRDRLNSEKDYNSKVNYRHGTRRKSKGKVKSNQLHITTSILSRDLANSKHAVIKTIK